MPDDILARYAAYVENPFSGDSGRDVFDTLAAELTTTRAQRDEFHAQLDHECAENERLAAELEAARAEVERLRGEREPDVEPVELNPDNATAFGECGCGSTSCAVRNSEHGCWCLHCNPGAWWMVTCGRCGDKRCRGALNHVHPCGARP